MSNIMSGVKLLEQLNAVQNKKEWIEFVEAFTATPVIITNPNLINKAVLRVLFSMIRMYKWQMYPGNAIIRRNTTTITVVARHECFALPDLLDIIIFQIKDKDNGIDMELQGLELAATVLSSF